MGDMMCVRCFRFSSAVVVKAIDLKADLITAGYDVEGISDDEMISFTVCRVCGFENIELSNNRRLYRKKKEGQK